MASRQLDEERVFHLARQITIPEARSEYLDQICAGDQALRERVEALLAVHEREKEFLKSVPSSAVTVDRPPITEAPGQQIGRFKLLQEIGEGGFGVVYMAEQARPVRRKVALKVIKPGMDTKAVVARFEAERQALAMMEHENIARVLDGGATDSGRPYFVMELVKGVPITEYCDQNHLPTDERLKLFISVCQAVQHAHQKGIIHRDLKPSNVLVTLHDGKPVVKVIDFGVAKAINQQLTEKTLFTSYGQMVGTPAYMSPEQAETSGLDVDTRSDVYSLGVLLYELLTGTTPLELVRLRTAGYAEIQRMIREEEPPKPSTRLSSSGEGLTIIAKHRSVAAVKLQRLVRGDLDWIVMRALEKDRSRRYDTPSHFEADVERFMNSEPIEARAPSATYRLTKFVRRNKGSILVAGLLVTALVVSTVVTGLGWNRERSFVQKEKSLREKADKETQAKKLTLERLADVAYREAMAAAFAGDHVQMRGALDVAREANEMPNRIRALEGLSALNLGDYEGAIAAADRILEQKSSLSESDQIAANGLLAIACPWAGRDERTEFATMNLRGHVAKSEFDHLFLAYASLSESGQAALRHLEDSRELQRTPVGLFLRGHANVQIGLEIDDGQALEKAVRDLEYTRLFFPNSHMVMAVQTWALSCALDLAKREGRPEDVKRYASDGRTISAELFSVSDAPLSDFCCWLFYRAAGDTEAATRAIHRAGRKPSSYSIFLAADCLRRNPDRFAYAEYVRSIPPEQISTIYSRLGEAYLIADLKPGGASQLVEDLTTHRSNKISALAVCALCRTSEKQEIEGYAEKALAAKNDRLASKDPFFWDRCLAFLAARIGEEQLIEDTKSAGRIAVAQVHFTIAMKRLSEGRREDARHHFAACVDVRIAGFFAYELALAHLERMTDESWPPSVHAKRAESAPRRDQVVGIPEIEP